MNSIKETNCTVAIVGIVKDIASSIGDDFRRIADATSIFSGVKWFLVESNSSDDSILAMNEVKKQNSNFDYVSVANSNSSSEPRTFGMGIARNRYLQELKENQNYKDVEYVIVADFNNLNSLVSKEAIATCFERVGWDACFANQTKKYYDIWALRHNLWSPNDCWEQHSFLRKYWKIPELALYASVQSRMIHIPIDSEWIQVESAFGGLAIYKKNVLLEATYSGTKPDGAPICEHVPLNLSLSQSGYRLFINPAFINTDSTDHTENAFFRGVFKRIIRYPTKLWSKRVDS
jgi:hypothetical protein